MIPDPMLRVGSALGFSNMQPEHAQRDIENGASIARDTRDAVRIFCPRAGQKIVRMVDTKNGIPEWDTGKLLKASNYSPDKHRVKMRSEAWGEHVHVRGGAAGGAGCPWDAFAGS